jgi:nucleoside-diphosphate-sugar epimerase
LAAGNSVLVTGAYGLVGRPVVERLVADGFTVIATAHRTVKPALPAAVDVRTVDLTKPDQVSALFGEVAPSAVVHLAACIPPLCYADRALARAVNVDATAALVGAAEAMPAPPRFVHASSMAVYGREIRTGSPACSPLIPRRWPRTCMAVTSWKPNTSCVHRVWSGRSFGSPASSPWTR